MGGKVVHMIKRRFFGFVHTNHVEGIGSMS